MFEALTMDEATWRHIVLFLALIPWLLYALVLSLFIISILYGRLKLHKRADPTTFTDALPGVTIIKPLMGVDSYLESNLESHFTIKYPKFEVLLCVQDDQDPAVTLVNKLMERYPKVDCRLFVGGKDGIINPMVQNMAPAYDNAKYDTIWISTSRIRASTEILMDMIAKIQNPKIALVHQVPFTTDQSGLAAAVEKVYFGSTVARYNLAFHTLGVSCFTGMSYLLRKPEIDELKGLTWFGRFLAEDFFIAKYLHEKGFAHQVSAVPAQQNLAGTTIIGYKDRMVRWLRLRMNMVPIAGCIMEPLGECFILGVYISWSASYLLGIDPYIWFACHTATWCFLDYIQLRGMQNGPLPFSKPYFILAWLIRELLYIFIYFEAFINIRRIRWGKRIYRLSNFGETSEILSDKSTLPI